VELAAQAVHPLLVAQEVEQVDYYTLVELK
jgi:hypothetical protein